MKKELEERYKSLQDKNAIAAELGISNLDLYFRDNILNNPDEIGAESLLENLERLDVEIDVPDSGDLEFEKLRSDRNRILEETDKTQIADFPLTSKEKSKWRNYRQYLRDLPRNYNKTTIFKYKIMTFKEFLQWKDRA